MNRLATALSAAGLSVAALLVAGTAGLAIGQEPKKVDNGAPADLIGAYTIVSGEKYGEKEDKDKLEGTTCRIAEDAIIVLDKDKKEAYVQTYKIDATTKPWKITMRNKVNPYSEKTGKAEELTAKGLIEQDGDTVRIIYALPGGEMPTEFKTKEKQLMFVMKNEKKASPAMKKARSEN